MDNINDIYRVLTKYMEEHNDDIVIINNNVFSLKEVMSLSSDNLLKLLSVRPGMKLYKYCPFNKKTKENIITGNAYLNNPLKFDDAFDSLSDVEGETYINIRLQFYLKVLNVEYDYTSSNDELERLLFIKMGEVADTKEKFEEYLSNVGVDIYSKSKFIIVYLNAMLSSVDENHSIKKALLSEYEEYSKNASRYRISCFTTNPLSLKMWSLYANNNKGVCIEYTVNDEPDMFVLSVLYSHVRGDINTCIAYDDVFTDDAFLRVLINSVLRKDICWQEQNEYRYVVANGMYEDNLAKFYPITAVYLGNKISKMNYRIMKNLCKRLNIDCYYMQRRLNEYELYPKKIND